MKKYDPKTIEPKWQQTWDDTKLYRAADTDPRDKYYYLFEFPYPSGDGLHVGHVRSQVALDIMARHKRMQGYNVLLPVGWDAFGLPTENYAIKHKIAPQIATAQNVANFKRQIKSLGISIDWDREINTTDPGYYKWTQWIFLQLLEKGLAYQAEMPINWCPKEKTGLANEEVVNGVHERCGTPVEKKLLKQWMLKITAYADRLVEDLKSVDYLDRIASQQVNWIGRSEGAEIEFTAAGEKLMVYTTRPDTLAGATFLVLAPEHPVVAKITTPEQRAAVEAYVKQAQSESEVARQDTSRPKTGVWTGATAKNPLSGEAMPVWVADYVLAGYGTGAIMAVPAHDERDHAFAAAMNDTLANSPASEFTDQVTPPRADQPFQERSAVQVFVKHPTEDKYLLLKKLGWETETYGSVTGGIESGETPLMAGLRELREETGYTHIASVQEAATPYYAHFYHEHKKHNLTAQVLTVVVALQDLHQEPVTADEKKLHELRWVTAEEFTTKIHGEGAKEVFGQYIAGNLATKLKIIPVIEPITGTPHGDDHKKEAIVGVVHNSKTNETLLLDWGPRHSNWGGMLFVGGGVDEGEDLVDAAKREVAEETGYHKLKFIRQTEVAVNNYYYSNVKDRHDMAHMTGVLFELEDDEQIELKQDEAEKNKYTVKWVPDDEVFSTVNDAGHEVIYRMLMREEAFPGEGVLINSGEFNGLSGIEAKRAITKWLFDKGIGKGATKYKLRDWIFSRQHYWGEPIPVVHCAKDGVAPVPADQLPVTLPEVESYEPTDTGESPLAAMTDWVDTTCPKCGGPAKRETDTMPNWAGSSWYWLRYMDPHNDKAFVDRAKLDYWGMVDLYNGGMEHTTLHLLYSRFWHKFLYDQGLVPTPEPYARRRSHGMILGPDGVKMSKSKGNVINPDKVVEEYGADTLRLYEMFMGPFDEQTAWSDERLNGVSRFMYRVWTLAQDMITPPEVSDEPAGNLGAFETEADRMTHKTLKKIHHDIENMQFNTAVSAFMEYINFLVKPENRARILAPDAAALRQRTVRTLTLMLAPFTPHLAEELWRDLGEEGSVHAAGWPKYDPELIKEDVATIVVQVNGKVRANLVVAVDASEDEVTDAAKADEHVAKYLAEGKLVKTIVVPRKLVNFVVK